MKKKIIMMVCAVVVLMGALLVKTLWNAGEFKRIEPFSLYSFVAVPGFPGVEDIDIDRGAAVALGSFTDRRAAIAGQKRPTSGILAYDLAAPGAGPVLLKTDFPGHLTPTESIYITGPTAANGSSSSTWVRPVIFLKPQAFAPWRFFPIATESCAIWKPSKARN